MSACVVVYVAVHVVEPPAASVVCEHDGVDASENESTTVRPVAGAELVL